MVRPTAIDRHLCSEMVVVTRTGQCRRIPGNLEEIGEWFAEILTDRAIPLNAAVRVSSRTHQLEGVVESCTFCQPLGFFVKVKLAQSSRWSERSFTPQHLLKFRREPEPKAFYSTAASGY
jgi:hypothetical protein